MHFKATEHYIDADITSTRWTWYQLAITQYIFYLSVPKLVPF